MRGRKDPLRGVTLRGDFANPGRRTDCPSGLAPPPVAREPKAVCASPAAVFATCNRRVGAAARRRRGPDSPALQIRIVDPARLEARRASQQLQLVDQLTSRGRGVESDQVALEHGRLDAVIAGLLFMAGCDGDRRAVRARQPPCGAARADAQGAALESAPRTRELADR